MRKSRTEHVSNAEEWGGGEVTSLASCNTPKPTGPEYVIVLESVIIAAGDKGDEGWVMNRERGEEREGDACHCHVTTTGGDFTFVQSGGGGAQDTWAPSPKSEGGPGPPGPPLFLRARYGSSWEPESQNEN